MFRRLHHQRILRLLEAFDADRLRRADCFFAGDTAIVLQLGEYRESVDIDFLCASQTGYRQLREVVTERSLGPLLARPVLSREDLYAEKLLANDDRGHAPETMSRDIIDLAMMIDGWGPLPAAALAKAEAVYGSTVRKRMHQAVERVSRPAVLRECMKQMSMDPALEPVILRALATLPR
ncbi:MAG: nucleotidyl transferase AbiEii/AbiGii toxin family protein [Pseudomonadota bacterium]